MLLKVRNSGPLIVIKTGIAASNPNEWPMSSISVGLGSTSPTPSFSRVHGDIVQLGSRAKRHSCGVVGFGERQNLVTKDEIIWSGCGPASLIAESNIQVHVSAMRKALTRARTGSACSHRGRAAATDFVGETLPVPAEDATNRHPRTGCRFPTDPSIAVIPLKTSGRSDAGIFADGIVEEHHPARSRSDGYSSCPPIELRVQGAGPSMRRRSAVTPGSVVCSKAGTKGRYRVRITGN